MEIEIIQTRTDSYHLYDGSRFLADCGKGEEGKERATTVWDEVQNLQLANDELKARLSRAEAEAAALKHKAEQYDDVVAAVQAADGGRYRNDTIEALLHRLSTVEALRTALEPFARFAGAYEKQWGEAWPDGTMITRTRANIALTLGDLRRAAEVWGKEIRSKSPRA